jgi:NTP pyrophosphatase (non-canonical NTP hydrolase)
MYRQDRRELFLRALNEWDTKEQMHVLQEECGELIVAVSHYRRKRPGCLLELREELADVYIMVGQIIEYLGSEFVEEMVDLKLERVKEQLDEGKRA